MGNFRVTSAPRYHTHVSRLVPRYSSIPKPFRCGCALEYLFLCTSEHFHFHFHFQGSLHHPRQLHPNTPSPQPKSAQVISFSLPWHFQVCLCQDASDIECQNHPHRFGPYRTSINQFGYLCGASYSSSRPLLPLISFEALQSSAVFCHSRHTSNFLICVGYHQTISLSPR